VITISLTLEVKTKKGLLKVFDFFAFLESYLKIIYKELSCSILNVERIGDNKVKENWC